MSANNRIDRRNFNFDDDSLIQDIFNCAKEVYGAGIAIPVDGGHPCGWDWIDFSCMNKDDDILTYKFDNLDISNGCSNGDYVGKTLKEILKITEGKFAFEVGSYINWYED